MPNIFPELKNYEVDLYNANTIRLLCNFSYISLTL